MPDRTDERVHEDPDRAPRPQVPRPEVGGRQVPRLVVCAGLPRSGSTRVYNAARLILGHAGAGPVLGAWIDDLDLSGDEARAARHVVVKTHAYDEHLAAEADAVLCTHRDLRDVAASMRRVGFAPDDDAALDAIDEALAHARRWEAAASCTIAFDDFVASPERTITRVARALGIELDAHAARDIERRIPVEAPVGDAYDPVTLLHPRHTDAGAPARVSARCAAILDERHDAWRRSHGYA